MALTHPICETGGSWRPQRVNFTTSTSQQPPELKATQINEQAKCPQPLSKLPTQTDLGPPEKADGRLLQWVIVTLCCYWSLWHCCYCYCYCWRSSWFCCSWIWLGNHLNFMSWQHGMSYEDGFRLMTLHTHGGFIVLSHWEIRLAASWPDITLSYIIITLS